MKNFLTLILGVLIGGALMYYFNSPSDVNNMVEINEPKGLITPAEAKVLDAAYNIKHNIINDSLFKGSIGGGDNRSSWFAIDQLKTYLTFAENQAGELGYTLDGIRVYLGAYPNSKEGTGLTTMFLIPTGKKNTAKGEFLSLVQGGSSDIPGGGGLNKATSGMPPGANYPQ